MLQAHAVPLMANHLLQTHHENIINLSEKIIGFAANLNNAKDDFEKFFDILLICRFVIATPMKRLVTNISVNN